MRTIDCEDLEAIAVGADLLGSGGGGKSEYERLMAQELLRARGPIKLIQTEDLAPDALVLPLAFIGAPLAACEKLCSLAEFPALLALVEKHYGRRPTAVLSAEIGGANAFTGIIGASLLDLPLVDGDLIGRAFPELQMASPTLCGISASPAFFADALGNSCLVQARQSSQVEAIGRQITVAMGSSALGGLYLMSGTEAQNSLVTGSMTLARNLGQAVMRSQDPVTAICHLTGGRRLGSGIIGDVQQEIIGGFLKGSVQVQGKQHALDIDYQNEYLIVRERGKPVACTPDLIVIVDHETGRGIASEALRFGLRVQVLALPAPKIWTSESGLKLVGPQAFQYDVEFSEVKI